MFWLYALIAGLIVGWIVSAATKETRGQSIFGYILMGAVGGLVGNWFFADLLKIGVHSSVALRDVLAIAWGGIGSLVFVAVISAIWPEKYVSDREEKFGRGYAHEYRDHEKDKDKDE
ncbi:MAG: hypothetical protein WCW17_01595 [Patescibacteria group bacterium]